MNQETAKPSSSVDCPAVTHKVDRYAVADKVDRCVHPDRIGAVTAKNDFPRCRHYTRNGRQCRLRVLDTQSGFCFRHARPQPVQSDSDDLSADLLGQLSAFESASEINQFLARLLVLVTKGRVSPRRASVLAYITNQLLHSHRAVDAEEGAAQDDGLMVIPDLPRPDSEDPELVGFTQLTQKVDPDLPRPNREQPVTVP